MNVSDEFSRCQKSVVQVFIKRGGEALWKSVGTGFVVSESQCLTCFHVIVPDEKAGVDEAKQRLIADKISVKVKFNVEGSESVSNDKRRKADNQTKADDLQANERIVNVTFVSPMSKYDLAVLSWNDSLPQGVEIARLTPDDDLSSLEFQCFGYPAVNGKDIPVMAPASGKFKERVLKTESFWWVESNDFEPGFSGAPLFSVSSRFVLGMYRRGHRTGRKGQVTGQADIRRECDKTVDFAALEVDHDSPLNNVKAEMAKRLTQSKQATAAVASAFGIKSYSDVKTVCSKLLATDKTVFDIASTFTDLIENLRKEKKVDERRTIVDAYVALLAGIFKQGTVREMRESLLQGQKVLLVEAANHSIAELLMAAVDGNVDQLKILQEGPEVLEYDYVVRMRESPDSREHGNAERQLDFIGEQLAEIWGRDWDAEFASIGDAKKRAERINDLVEVYSKPGRRLVLVDDRGMREEPDGAIPEGYSALVVLRLRNPEPEQRRSQNHALAPVLFGREPRVSGDASGKSASRAGRKRVSKSREGGSKSVRDGVAKNVGEGRRKVGKTRRRKS